MLKLTRHHRFHVPNRLAILAAVLLLVSSAGRFNSASEVHSTRLEASPSANIESTENDSINDAVEQKRRGLNLGFLLFRRG